jgi:hypothetical protein
MKTIERARDRKALVAAAGLPATSVVSVLAGTLTAIGAVAILLAAAAGIGELLDLSTSDLNGDNWDDIGLAGAIVFAVVTLLGYLFGGYVAGRMARRAGVRHGVLVFALGLLLTLGAAGIASAVGDGDAAVDELRDQGVPTDADDWSGVGLVAGLATLGAMLAGAVIGGTRGERWHGRLVTRAADPTVRSRDEERAEQTEARAAEERHAVESRYADQWRTEDADHTTTTPADPTEVRTEERHDEAPHAAGWQPVGSGTDDRLHDVRGRDRS